MSERGEALLVCEREIEAVEIIFMLSGFTVTISAHSIFEEVVGFSPFMVSSRKNTMFIVSCV